MPHTSDNRMNELTHPDIDHLLAAVIQIQDQKKTCDALKSIGISAIELSTVGGFLGRQNVTLLLGLHHSMLQPVLQVFNENCRQRTEYVSTPLEGTPLPIPLSTPVTIGGAIIFTLDLDRYEEF